MVSQSGAGIFASYPDSGRQICRHPRCWNQLWFRPSRSIIQAGLVLCAVILFSGCTGGRLPTAPVRGKVTYKGAPLNTGTVTFVPDTTAAPCAYGEIGADGSYELTTYKRGDGAVLGTHRIMVSALKVDPKRPEATSLVPSKFSSEQTSGLAADVQKKDNVVDLSL
jgi:hypothetical protein